MNEFDKYSHILFDLDNTIYDESDYLYPAYKEIAIDSEVRFGIDQTTMYNFLKSNFETSGRVNLFSKMIVTFSLPEYYLENCLFILRNIKLQKPLEIFPHVHQLLVDSIQCSKTICVITNGNPQQQKNKIKQINWQGLDSKIRFILANEFIPKPNPGSFKETNIKQTELSQTVYIGDSNTDEEFAANIGIAFIHINLVLHNG